MFIISCDLAKTSDFTAISILERYGQPCSYRMRYLTRPRHGTSYMIVADRLKEIIGKPELQQDGLHPLLVIDGTGVGAAVEDILRAQGVKLLSIKIHGGNSISWKGMDIGVPKRDLVFSLLSVFNKGNLEIPNSIPEKQDILKELRQFKVKINPKTRRATYAGAGAHDDIIISLAMAVFVGEKVMR